VKSIDTQFLATDSNVLSSQHSGVGRGLVTVGLDLHTAGNSDNGFTATTQPSIFYIQKSPLSGSHLRKISHVNECVIKAA
jgi:hypothetical protein